MPMGMLIKANLAVGFLLAVYGLTEHAALAARSGLALLATGVLLGLVGLGQAIRERLAGRGEER